MPDHGWKIGLILWALACGLVIIGFRWPPKLGIDLSGGVILVYEVDQDKKDPNKPVKMDDIVDAVSERVNPGGQKEMTIRPYGVEQIEIIIPEADENELRRVKGKLTSMGTLEFRILANNRDHKALIQRARREKTDVLKELLLSVGLKFQDELDRGVISANLGREFENHQVTLSENVRVSTEKKGSTWLIADQDEVYEITKDKKTLNVRGVAAWWVPLREGDKPTDRERVNGILSYPEIEKRTRKRGNREVREILVVKDVFNVDGRYLTDAARDWDETGNPRVSFQFDPAGGRLFGRLTSLNLPSEVQDFYRKLGVILDGRLYSAPRINSAIYERGVIEGSFTDEEVKDLVDVLNAGSLPAALAEEPISELVTGPTLGHDTIVKGSWAIGISVVLVLVFMLFYYRFAGIIACAALLTNLVLILAIMITIGAAFTLPGLAGLVLTVGMAVDANVLIFERIREELGRGAALRMAIRNGFSRATTTIVDANLTTLITGIILFVIGTDVIKGFAITLILGVLLSMYTAIFCSRVVFDIAERRRWITKLTMMRILGATQIDFLGKRRLAAAFSLLVIVAGLVGVSLRSRGQHVRLLDIDFTGGVSVEILFDQTKDIREVRSKLSDLPDLAVKDVNISGEPRGKRFVVNTSQRPLMDEKDPKKIKKSAILVVEDRIHEVFGRELTANSIDHYELQSGRKETAKTPPAKPAHTSNVEHTRDDLPDDSVLALRRSQLLTLAQTDSTAPKSRPADAAANDPSSDKPSEKAPEGPSDEGAPAPVEDTPDGSPANLTTETSDQTEWELVLSRAVDAATLREWFVEQYGSEQALPLLELSSPDPEYEEGDGKAYETWTVKIGSPQDQAEVRIKSIQKTVSDTPFFPSSNTIGGTVASSTRRWAIVALAASLLFIVAYIWIRFQRVIFGLAAVVALVHDVLVTLGVIALSAFLAPYLGFLLIDPFKIGLPVVAAFLTIIGYSLNDTIVVFDRIREVRGKTPRLTQEMVNTSINQTLARTLLTSLTTLIVVLILYVAGGQAIHAFAFALVIGVLVGTYSSIFVASPALLWMTRPSKAK